MRYSREDQGHSRLATFDIETTSTDPSRGELVSIGVGVHERTDPLTEATYGLFHRQGDDEVELIQRAVDWLDDTDADALVSYNGLGFDLGFIEGRLEQHGAEIEPPAIALPENHIDLFVDRQQKADEEGRRWPRLEECLAVYDYPPAKTLWQEEPITNTRFGEEIGPAYLRTLSTTTGTRLRDALIDAIEHYLITDLEANFTLFYADIGEQPEIKYSGIKRDFDI